MCILSLMSFRGLKPQSYIHRNALCPTDDLGQVNLVIGQGTANTGTFSELDWSLGSYYLGIELDTGNGYVAMGTTQLLSVPYALICRKQWQQHTNNT